MDEKPPARIPEASGLAVGHAITDHAPGSHSWVTRSQITFLGHVITDHAPGSRVMSRSRMPNLPSPSCSTRDLTSVKLKSRSLACQPFAHHRRLRSLPLILPTHSLYRSRFFSLLASDLRPHSSAVVSFPPDLRPQPSSLPAFPPHRRSFPLLCWPRILAVFLFLDLDRVSGPGSSNSAFLRAPLTPFRRW